MRELKFALHPSIDPTPRGGGRSAWPLSRNAFIGSVLVHLAGAYVVTRVAFDVDTPLPIPPSAEFLWLGERPLPRVVAEPPSVAETPPQVEPRAAPAEPPQPRRAAPQPVPEVVLPEPRPVAPVPETQIGAPPLVAPGVDFDEERRRAAAAVIEERASDSYLTFSIDDVAPPLPKPEPKPERSIFDGGGGSSGPSIGQVGQQRTRFGRKLAEFCNALTGGFGVAFQGFGLFSACARPDDEPSGLFPEARPAYLDLLPECAESQPEQPELAAAAPFSTVKCRLVQQELPARGPPR